MEKNLFAFLASTSRPSVSYHPFGQGAGLVGAEDIHAAEIFNRGEPFDNHFLMAMRLAPWARLMLMMPAAAGA